MATLPQSLLVMETNPEDPTEVLVKRGGAIVAILREEDYPTITGLIRNGLAVQKSFAETILVIVTHMNKTLELMMIFGLDSNEKLAEGITYALRKTDEELEQRLKDAQTQEARKNARQ